MQVTSFEMSNLLNLQNILPVSFTEVGIWHLYVLGGRYKMPGNTLEVYRGVKKTVEKVLVSRKLSVKSAGFKQDRLNEALIASLMWFSTHARWL